MLGDKPVEVVAAGNAARVYMSRLQELSRECMRESDAVQVGENPRSQLRAAIQSARIARLDYEEARRKVPHD